MTTKPTSAGQTLCLLGPGGDFRCEVHDNGPGLLDLESTSLSAAQLGHLRNCLSSELDLAGESAANACDARVWAVAQRPLPPVVYGSLSAYLAEEYDGAKDQATVGLPDAQATARAYVHPGLQQRARVRTDDAGAGRRVRSQQGYRLRA